MLFFGRWTFRQALGYKHIRRVIFNFHYIDINRYIVNQINSSVLFTAAQHISMEAESQDNLYFGASYRAIP